MEKPYLLWLVWQNTETRNRYHVGNLIFIDGYYIFQYENQKEHRGLTEALQNGYSPHLAFPDTDKVYRSEKLFGPFSRRLPNPGRPDYKRLLRKYGVLGDQIAMDILRATGGKLATDTYEFVKPIQMEETGFAFDFHIAGWRYYEGEDRLEYLRKNSRLLLEKEPTNLHDPYAVMVKTLDHSLLGYIPAFYSEFMSSVINDDLDYKIEIEKIDDDAIPQFKVMAKVSGEFKQNNAPFTELMPVVYS